jgi:hypothetical protein
MRRLLLVAAVSVLVVLGFGAAYVLAGGLNSKQSIHIRLCHSGSGHHFTLIHPSDVGALDGHIKNDPADIIPPFVIVDNGTEVSFPGRNMDHVYAGGYTGAEVLANDCEIPEGPVITQTETTETTTDVEVTVTTPDTTVTLPATTNTSTVTVTVTAPGETTTAPGTTATITTPNDVTTTVTLPSHTTTLPGVTTTLAGQTVERPPNTVTLPAVTATVTASGTTTVFTVTGPGQVVQHPSVVVKKQFRATVRTPKHVIHVAGRVYRITGKGKFRGKRIVVIVSRTRGCPSGTVLFNGRCSAVVRGKG